MNVSFEELLEEREEFENFLYDTLIGNHLFTPFIIEELPNEDSPFWDPVVVCLTHQQINNLETINQYTECLICTEKQNFFKKVGCCNNKMCEDCTYDWFKVSVFCPFCKRDQREVVSKPERF